MKKTGLLFIIIGVLLPMNSTFFATINMRENIVLIISFWGLLILFQIFFAWNSLFSKSKLKQYQRIVIFTIFTALTLVWIGIVFFEPDRKLIFTWALNALSFSVFYFAGLLIYKRES